MNASSNSAASGGKTRSPLCSSPAEELANAITHGIGVPLSIIALVAMLIPAVRFGDAWQVVSVSVFGASLIGLYLCSCIYHSVTGVRWKRVMQVMDHALIFVLIAGSYTPFVLVTLRGPWGWSLFGVIWGLTLVGIVAKAILLPRFERSTSAIYVVMGWLVVFAIGDLIRNLPPSAFAWLVAGGVSYTVGVIFFLMKAKYAHAVWHLFVLAGSTCHVMAVILGVVPQA